MKIAHILGKVKVGSLADVLEAVTLRVTFGTECHEADLSRFPEHCWEVAKDKITP